MKKVFIWGIIIGLIIAIALCGKKDSTYVSYDTAIKDDNSVYDNEISIQNEPKNKQNKTGNDQKQYKEFKQTESKPVSIYANLSNKKFGWGIKRNNEHKPPEVYQSTKDLFNKYNAIYIGDTNRKVVYLTFDEGYENGYTPKILDTLKANNVKAAFFVTGPYVQKHGDLVERMINEGHIVGNHTINHPSLPDISPEQLDSEVVGLDRMVYERWKYNMKFMRPPMGEYSERVLAQLKDLGHTTVFWSFGYSDYDVNNQRGTDYAYQMIMDNLHNGAILLLHAVSKDNANVLDRIIKDARAQGYEFRSLDSIKL